MQPYHEFATAADFARAGADAIERALRSVLQEKETVTLAVPGGSTARALLPGLAKRALPWQRIHVTLVDERWVAAEDPDSNEGLLRVAFASCPGIRISGLYINGRSPTQALALLATQIPEPDIALLGMGEDGHVASLFPHDAANSARERFVEVRRQDFTRVTMTARALRAVPNLILAFAGAAKRDVFGRARHPGPSDDYPVRHVLEKAQVLIGP